MTFDLISVHVRTILREYLRSPAFVIPTVGFPAMFYTIFGLPYARLSPGAADQVLCGFTAFAVVGVALFQFGVGIASERGRPWERYMRTLPVDLDTRLAARVAVALLFAAVAAGLVAILARILTPIDFTPVQWAAFASYALAGAVPFVLAGIALAYWCPPRAALPMTNVIYLLAAFAGGLWIPPAELPKLAAAISPFLPTREYLDLLLSVATGHGALHALGALGYFALAFTIVAIFGFRRDERARYA
jgi:ABC-2 type transport system permease protein